MRRVACLIALALAGSALADDVPERTVKDLAYGEVLFEYFQDDHFSALTRLLAALERNELPSHAHEADLMLGALYLSYGQHQIAGSVFEQVLEQSVEPEIHDRAWYFLATIWYQRGYLTEAEAALARIGDALPEAFRDQRVMLEAQVLMAQQRFPDALALLEAWEDPDDEWVAYSRYNIGVAQVRLGEVAAGADVLSEVGSMEIDADAAEDVFALRDKANVALGYAWLQDAQPAAAKPVLQRVRLEGPYSNKALLGVGWADAEQQNYRSALAPWVELNQRDLLDTAVQESWLAVPYAFSQLQADAQAADYYLRAIDAYTAEIDRIDDAIDTVESGALLSDLLSIQEDEGTGWYFRLERIPQTVESQYLIELLAGNQFQEGIKNYRDLLELNRNLTGWLGSLGSFDDILDTRVRAFESRQPVIESSVNSIDLEEMQRQRVTLESRLLMIEQTQDAIALGTSDQQRLWAELEAMEPQLALIAGEPDAEELSQKQRLFKGLLQWDLERDYGLHLWTEQRELRELERELTEAESRRHTITSTLESWPETSAELSARIGQLRPRVETLLAETDTTILAQRSGLEQVAVGLLAEQRDRLNTYLVQARFSLATIYDRAAVMAEERR